MRKNDFRATESRWRRKRMFGDRRSHPIRRIVTVVFILIALAVLAWWMDVLPFDLPITKGLP